MGGQGGGKRGYTYYYSTGGRPAAGGQGVYEEVDVDIKAVLPVPRKLAEKGGEAKFKLSGGKNITLSVPAGIKDGQKMRLRGQGNKCPYCRHNGDLIVTIRVQK